MVEIFLNNDYINRNMNLKTLDTNWVRQAISRLAYGETTEKGIRPNISKKNLLKKGKLSPKKLPKTKILDHINHKTTIYYYGNGRRKDKNTLVMIDIDIQKIQKKGSTQGAINFVEHLKEKFKSLYYEPSTNKKGIHAYFLLEKEGHDAKRVNKILKGFENWLRAEAKKIGADIEQVEVKGSCPELVYHNNEIINIKYGTLAKLPRDIDVAKECKIFNIDEIEKEYFIQKKEKENKGSVSNKLFNEKDLEELKRYEEFFVSEIKSLKAREFRVTKHDWAVATMILLFINTNPNSDDSVPTDRIRGLWNSLYEKGDINRKWNHHRWKAIRDKLSELDLIEWIDNKYTFGDKGKKIKGQACKWKLTKKFVLILTQKAQILAPETERVSLMDSRTSNKEKTNTNSSKHSYLVPVLRYIIDRDKLYRMSLKVYDSLCYV